jgi:hypothetical protein
MLGVEQRSGTSGVPDSARKRLDSIPLHQLVEYVEDRLGPSRLVRSISLWGGAPTFL